MVTASEASPQLNGQPKVVTLKIVTLFCSIYLVKDTSLRKDKQAKKYSVVVTEDHFLLEMVFMTYVQ
jgi:hypothetical protein